MSFLFEYGLFLAKVLTLVASLIVLFMAVASAGQRIKKLSQQGHIEIESINDKFRDLSDAMQAATLPEDAYEEVVKAEKKEQKAKLKAEKAMRKKSPSVTHDKPRIFVVDFIGDIRASAADELTEKITAILTQAKQSDEVVLRLESSGGMVHSYGFAASQLQRIRDASVKLTVCVDKVAASGGYMMACIGNQILAAPFAVIGSIGVVAQIPNFNRLLKKHDVDYEMLTAGEYKRTLTMLGENTDKGRQKFQEEIQETHDLFKEFVASHRPSLDINAVATGETWFGKKALSNGLVDDLQTSEGYLFSRHPEVEIFQVKWVEKKTVAERFGLAVEMSIERIVHRAITETNSRKVFFR